MNQFQKTPAEREAIKQAKKAYKDRKPTLLPLELLSCKQEVKKEQILTGIMNEEEILPNDYAIYPDYMYVVEFKDGTAKVIKSDYQGNVGGFKRDLISYPGYKGKYNDLVNIRNCKMGARNLF